MNFFSKHYEKVLLGVLLLVFFVLLIYLLQITKDAKNISERDLQIKEPEVDYEPVNFKEGRFIIDSVFKPKIEWKAYGTRMVDAEGKQVSGIAVDHVTDLLSPLKAAACPGCGRFIPTYYFVANGSCPVCGSGLTAPAKSFNDDADFGTRPSDTDGDGLPDIYEEQFSFLNPAYAGDAKRDQDGDGFSNLYEYMCGTDLEDAASHPPLTDLLYIESARPPQFGASLQSVDSARGSISLLLASNGRTRDLRVGGLISIDRRSYTLVEILDENSAKMKLNSNGKDFVISVGQESCDIPEMTMTLMNLGPGCSIEIKKGTKIVIGKSESGRERWEVISMDMNKGVVSLENQDGEKFELTTQAKIPMRARIDR